MKARIIKKKLSRSIRDARIQSKRNKGLHIRFDNSIFLFRKRFVGRFPLGEWSCGTPTSFYNVIRFNSLDIDVTTIVGTSGGNVEYSTPSVVTNLLNVSEFTIKFSDSKTEKQIDPTQDHRLSIFPWSNKVGGYRPKIDWYLFRDIIQSFFRLSKMRSFV
jgi:hypothetical protein